SAGVCGERHEGKPVREIARLVAQKWSIAPVTARFSEPSSCDLYVRLGTIAHFVCLPGVVMAVQQNKKSASRRGMHRAHDFLTNPPTAIEPTTGEVHRRHHVSPNGYYRGKKVVQGKEDQ